jgi:hypothetical protein
LSSPSCLHWASRFGHLLRLVPVAALSWITGVSALYLILRAMRPDVGLGFGVVVGAAALAATLGSLAVVVPEGLGVSEGVLAGVLVHATRMPLADCMAAALAMWALDPWTKLSLLALVTGMGKAAAADRVVHAGEQAQDLLWRLSRCGIGLAVAVSRGYRNTRLRWLPLPALGLGVAVAVCLPHLGGLTFPDIDL